MSMNNEGLAIVPDFCLHCGGNYFAVNARVYMEDCNIKGISVDHSNPHITCIDCQNDIEPNETGIDFTKALVIKAALKDDEFLELQSFAMIDQDDGEGMRIAQRGETVTSYDLVLRAMNEDGEVLPDNDFILEFDDLTEEGANRIVAHIEKTLDIICDHIGE